MAAGRLDRRLRFESRVDGDDGAGNELAQWVARFECSARREWLRGGEQFIGERNEVVQPVLITIRSCAAARLVTGDWRAIDVRDNRIYKLVESAKESDSRGYLLFHAEAGIPS